MFKEIVELRKNFALVKFEGQINEDFLSYNVVFEDTKKILGEIEEITENVVKISFLGEFINGKFYSGIIKKPSLTAKVRIINKDELSELVGDNNPKAMMLGISPLYNYPVKIDIDDMFSNHSAIFGNTGSGKTYGVARLVQNLFVMKNKPFQPVSYGKTAALYLEIQVVSTETPSNDRREKYGNNRHRTPQHKRRT